MGTRQRVLAPWAVLLLALQVAGASHVIHRSLEAEAAPPSVPASIVSPLLQPPMNWINGMLATSLEVGMITPPAWPGLPLRLALLISLHVFTFQATHALLVLLAVLQAIKLCQTMDTEC
jgi:hypothetical protein